MGDSRIMRLLLASMHIEKSPRAVPLGPAMLASMLNRDMQGKLQTDLLNLYLHQSPIECAEMILAHSPDFVGLSTYIWNISLALNLAEILKERKPDITIFAGGPEASTASSNVLANTAIDFVLAGECEEIIVPAMDYLLKGGDPSKMRDIASRAPVDDLAVLPSPYLDGTIDPKDYSGMLWELSRGCPFKCDFCYESRGASEIRRFPSDRLKRELRVFSESGVDQVFVLDPTFNYNKKAAKEMLRLIAEEAPCIYYFFEVRSESIDAELAYLFASVGCTLQIGLQSAFNDVLRNVSRSIDRDDFERKILLLHEAGAVYGFDLIYGLPGDSLEGFCKSLDFALSLIPNHVDIFPLAVLPGTRLQETAPSFNLKYQPCAPYQVQSSPGFSDADMGQAADIAHAFDLFYNRGKAVPWFAMLTNALELAPSAFIKEFASWSKEEATTSIVALQKRFAAYIFEKQEKESLAALAVDIIGYFGELEAQPDEGVSVLFNHNPVELVELLESGVTDLKELARVLPRKSCSATIVLRDGSAVIEVE